MTQVDARHAALAVLRVAGPTAARILRYRYLLFMTLAAGQGLKSAPTDPTVNWVALASALDLPAQPVAVVANPIAAAIVAAVTTMVMDGVRAIVDVAFKVVLSPSVRRLAPYVIPAVAAILLPPTYWRAYVHDVRETFGYRVQREEGTWTLTWSFVQSFPRLFVQEWFEAIRYAVWPACAALQSGGRWIKRLEGWKAHLFWALVAAVMIEPIAYMVTYVLWLFHREMPWEFYFPMG